MSVLQFYQARSGHRTLGGYDAIKEQKYYKVVLRLQEARREAVHASPLRSSHTLPDIVNERPTDKNLAKENYPFAKLVSVAAKGSHKRKNTRYERNKVYIDRTNTGQVQGNFGPMEQTQPHE